MQEDAGCSGPGGPGDVRTADNTGDQMMRGKRSGAASQGTLELGQGRRRGNALLSRSFVVFTALYVRNFYVILR